jgi:transcriptional regulator with XRE-family HTH domain
MHSVDSTSRAFWQNRLMATAYTSLSDEKHAFAKRLKDCLRKANVNPRSSTRVAREFNLRYPGDPITMQAVRKWLEAEAMPSQDKLRALAQWLDVPAQWLRFGEPVRGAPSTARQDAAPYKSEIAWVAKKFDVLNDPHKKMVVEMVHALLRLEGKQ